MFDFDERDEGNLERIPKHWAPLRARDFPSFAVGEFDEHVGRLAPPSFHLQSSGRNVAFQYAGPELRVRLEAEYRLEGFIRPDRLTHARTCLSACYLTRQGDAILDTLVRSRYAGSESAGDEWARLELFLPPAPPDAYTISVIAWLVQENLWEEGPPSHRRIDRVDVHAGVWIDDLTVYRLPRVILGTSSPGNVLSEKDPARLNVLVSDVEFGPLTARLSITDASGQEVLNQSIPVVRTEGVGPIPVSVESLGPGVYRGRLEVFAGETRLLSRWLQFVRLSPSARSSEHAAKSFGIVLDPERSASAETEIALLRRQVARSVKAPIWSGGRGGSAPSRGDRSGTMLLHELAKDGFALTAVVSGLPPGLVPRNGDGRRSISDWLDDDPATWQSAFGEAGAPYAGVVRWWEIGEGAVSPSAFAKASRNLREALRSYTLLPRLAATISTLDDPAAVDGETEMITCGIAPDAAEDAVRDRIAQIKARNFDETSVLVEPLPAETFDRRERLGRWAKQLIVARHAGAETIYVPQTWRAWGSVAGDVVEPLEEYVLLATLADQLGDAQPGPVVPLVGGARCLAFFRGDEAVVALWDDDAPPEGAEHAIQLGAASRAIDLWGRITPLTRDDLGRHVVQLTSTPLLVDGVQRWLMEFVSSLTVTPSQVEPGNAQVRHRLESSYRGQIPAVGRGELVLPSTWELGPLPFSFLFGSGRNDPVHFTVRYSHREPAGRRLLTARLWFEHPDYFAEIPLAIDVGLNGIVVQGVAFLEGDDLVVQHRVKNEGAEVAHFRGSIAVPGRERHSRPFANLRPGDVQSVEYRYRDAAELRGRSVVVGLRELNDGPRVHNLELIVE